MSFVKILGLAVTADLQEGCALQINAGAQRAAGDSPIPRFLPQLREPRLPSGTFRSASSTGSSGRTRPPSSARSRATPGPAAAQNLPPAVPRGEFPNPTAEERKLRKRLRSC